MTDSVEYFFDFSSPNAYFSTIQIQNLSREMDVDIVWKPIFLGGLLRDLNTTAPAFQNELKRSYLRKDLQRWSKKYQIPFSMPDEFPIMTVRPLRGVLHVMNRRPESLTPYINAVFTAYWVDNRDISERNVLEDIVESLELETESFFEDVQSEEIKQELKNRNDRAKERGVFGVPTFIVGGELFWGKDRLDFVRDALLETES